MNKTTVDVYTNEHYFGKETEVAEVIKEYPFLENEHFGDGAVLTIKSDEITLEYREVTDAQVVAWKKDSISGEWAHRVTFE